MSKKKLPAKGNPILPQETERSLLSVLLLLLVFVLLVVPLTESLPFATTMLRIGITAVPVLAALANKRGRGYVLVVVIAVTVVGPTHWFLADQQPALFAIGCIAESLIFSGLAVSILFTVLQRHLATIHSVFGAISAYLLLGLAWALLYWGLDQLDEGSMLDRLRQSGAGSDGHSEVASISEFIYFSFVTMSTLGYGDVVPTTPMMRTVAWMQSVIGQFYMAVLVAWLVSEIPKRQQKEPPHEPAPS